VRLADAHSERFQALIYLAVDSGMRWGELVGLRRSGVDVRRLKVRVTQQLVQIGSGDFVRRGPKTAAGIRSISIAPFTAEVLGEHLEQFSNHGPDGLVFPNSAGNPLASSSFLTHHFVPAQRRAGVRCRFHDLRHTSVALAIASGAHPKSIQARMGHASINVTLDPYGHLSPELDEAIAKAFGRGWKKLVVGGRTPWCTRRSARTGTPGDVAELHEIQFHADQIDRVVGDE
jgi:integrase